MSAIAYTAFDAYRARFAGAEIKSVLREINALYQKSPSLVWEREQWKTITDSALSESRAFAVTCLKVAFVGTLLTTFMPFLFGTLVACVTFGALTGAVLINDLVKVIERFAILDQNAEPDLVSSFRLCKTVSARIEFMVKETFLIKWLPTRLLERVEGNTNAAEGESWMEWAVSAATQISPFRTRAHQA